MQRSSWAGRAEGRLRRKLLPQHCKQPPGCALCAVMRACGRRRRLHVPTARYGVLAGMPPDGMLFSEIDDDACMCIHNPVWSCNAHQKGAYPHCFGRRGFRSHGMASCMLVECLRMPWCQSRAQPPCVQSSAQRCFCSGIGFHTLALGLYLLCGRSCMTVTVGGEVETPRCR